MQVLLAADADQLVALANFLQQSTPSPRIGDLYLMSQARGLCSRCKHSS